MISTNKKTVVRDIPQPFNRQAVRASQIKPAVTQPKTTVFTQSDIRQISPPVFRPQSAPSAVQPKLANGVVRQKTPIAPLVYRPQPVPKVLQKKSGATELPQTVQSPRQPIAPPVYAPVAKKIAQPKLRTAPKAPPVYRPTQGGIAQPKLATARPADKLPKAPSVYQVEPKQLSLQPSQPLQKKSRAVTPQASAPRTARQKKEFSAARALTPLALAAKRQGGRLRLADAKPDAIQRYSVLSRDRIVFEMPTMVNKPEPDLPYAVVAGAEFLAQQSLPGRWGSDKGHDFLTSPGGQDAWVVGRPFGQALRLSDDGNMAIEDTDLSRRQPKEFYATSTIVREANHALKQVGARVSLTQGSHALTIVTAKRQVIALYTVTPVFVKPPPQNCNAMAAEIIGSSSSFTAMKKSAGMNAAKKIAVKTAPLHTRAFHSKEITPQEFEKLEGTLVEEYVHQLPQSQHLLKTEQINQYAQPGIGEAFMIGTLGNPTKQSGGTARVLDFESGEDRTLGWGFHFAGVVAVSGDDRVTLENYARGDDRRDDPDPRWFFQMYGGSGGQTFYDFHKAKGEFSNPVVVSVKK